MWQGAVAHLITEMQSAVVSDSPNWFGRRLMVSTACLANLETPITKMVSVAKSCCVNFYSIHELQEEVNIRGGAGRG